MTTSVAQNCSSHARNNAGHQHNQEQAPSDPQDCGRCDCQWLTGAVVAIEIDLSYPTGTLAVADLAANVSVSSVENLISDGHFAAHSALGVRAHLALNVLLV